jgi:nucleoid-associated protein YgaU
MGVPLFKFAGNIGKKVFNRGEDSSKAAEKLKQHVEKNNPGVNDLQVAVAGETVTISGSAADQAAFEKAVLIAGNVEGVGEVEAVALQKKKPDGSESTFILVEKGDTLWGIAQRTYGNGARYTEIFEANREVIEDPDLIFPGQKLRIPAG